MVWPFAAESPWNVPLGKGVEFEAADGPCSRALRDTKVGSDINAAEWSHPVYVAAESDPTVRIFVGGDMKAKLRVPKDAEPSRPKGKGSDRHLHVIDPTRHFVDEMWRAKRNEDGDFVAEAYARNDLFGMGVEKGGVRAYGGSAIGGLIRKGELKNGIRHVLAMALPRRLQKRGPVWPATLEDDGSERDYRGTVPMGQLVALPRELRVGHKGLEELGAEGRILFRALQDFGAYDVDSAADVSLYAEPGAEEELGAAREAWAKLRPFLRCVTNNRKATPGGPGARVAPVATAVGTGQ